MEKLPQDLLDRIGKVTNRRARVVLDTIVKKGSITTEELKEIGYDHPPRAARDARELGFSLVTIRVKSRAGRSIGAYTFGSGTHDTGKSGRQLLPKKERDEIMERAGRKCQLCGATHNLQVDHRIPYEVAGESEANKKDPYQVLCGSCNRKKSWDCEHCRNWLDLKDMKTCRTCYWASPETYGHVAMKPERRIEIIWNEKDFEAFESLRDEARKNRKSIADMVKEKLSNS